MIVDYLVRLGVGAGWVPRHLRLPLGHPRRTEMKQEMKQSLPKGTLELLILRGISRGPQHGYALARWIEQRSEGALLIEEGSLYPAVHRLERAN